MFMGKGQEATQGASLGQAQALLTNIRLGWKGSPGTNALAYYEHSQIAASKSFIALGHGANVTQLFTDVIYKFLY